MGRGRGRGGAEGCRRPPHGGRCFLQLGTSRRRNQDDSCGFLCDRKWRWLLQVLRRWRCSEATQPPPDWSGRLVSAPPPSSPSSSENIRRSIGWRRRQPIGCGAAVAVTPGESSSHRRRAGAGDWLHAASAGRNRSPAPQTWRTSAGRSCGCERRAARAPETGRRRRRRRASARVQVSPGPACSWRHAAAAVSFVFRPEVWRRQDDLKVVFRGIKAENLEPLVSLIILGHRFLC